MELKRITVLLSAFLLLGSSVAFAANTQTVKATVSNLKYTLNGKNWTAKTTAKPVVINGTTYLPVGVVKEATKTNITVDSKTGKINIGEKGVKTPFQQVSFDYDYFSNTRNKSHTNIEGKEYKEVLYTKFSAFAHDYSTPDKKYQTLHLDLFAPKETVEITVFEDLIDDRSLGNISVEPGKVTSLEVNVTDVKKIMISLKNFDNGEHEFVILPTSYYK
ncbi:stalk domain-containing protein [Paenibacillus sp. An7]|uniref:stalk domain-containing protein n=1 Tax=Paenibacillus sp. An7 TaxID=2689577 RepID=UPI00135A14EE|nr:stalk domain-containing protein [Paenibacillus sp. An7]